MKVSVKRRLNIFPRLRCQRSSVQWMMLPPLKYTLLILLTACTLLTLFATSLRPTDVELQSIGDGTKHITLPLAESSTLSGGNTKDYILTGHFSSSLFSQHLVHITPDDCIEYLRINRVNVDLHTVLRGNTCDYRNGFDIDLKNDLKNGTNQFEIGLRNYGGWFGLRMTHSSYDRPYVVLLAMLILEMATLLSFLFTNHFQLPHMEEHMQKDRIENNAQKIRSLRLRLGFITPEFQAMKSGTPTERDDSSRMLERGILWFLFLLSIVLRISLYKIQIFDYNTFLLPWYDYIQAHGGFTALKDSFSDYNVPYLYLLALTTYIPIQPIVAIKALSIVFDPLLALFAYLILRLKYPHGSVPTIGAVIILFTPTVFLNSAAWGQCDAIYTAWCLGSLYFLLSKRPVWACLCFGLALSFKPQALFFLPVLLVPVLTRKLPIRCLILIPVIYVALLAPALLEGRDAWSLLTIYIQHTKDNAWALTLNAPNFYQWLPAKEFQDWIQMGMILTLMMIALICYLTLRSKKPITPEIILKLTLVFAFVIPFLLPSMHDRYFYLADIVSIICAFYFPRYFYMAVLEQLCSLMSYATTLFNTQVVNLTYVAFVVLFLAVVTLADLVKTLYPTSPGRATMPVAFSKDLASKAPDTLLSPEVENNMDSSKILNDGLSSEGTSNMDSSKDGDAAPLEEEDVAGLPPKGQVLQNHGLEKEAFRGKIDRRPSGLLHQEIKMFLEQPISYVIKKTYTKEHLPFLLIVALATFLRFYRFVSLPMGFQPEEVNAAYESYALLLRGTDRWGNVFPILFPAWGSGFSVLLSYLDVPFVKIFGLTIFAHRFLAGILGVLTIVIVYAFVKKWYDTKTALIAAFLLSTNPWHIMISRWAMDSNMLPFSLLLGITFLSYCYTSRYSRILIPFSLFFLAICLYAYTVAIFILPTFLVLYFSRVGPTTLWRNKWSVLASLLIFLLVASPYFLFLLDNFILHTTPAMVQHLPFTVPLLISSRFDQIGGGQNVWAENTQFLMSGFRDGLVWNMASDYSPLGLLSLSLASALGISPSSFGLLSIPLLPALGIYYSIKKRNTHANIFLIWLMSIVPILFIFPLNINRGNALFIPLIALSTIGISGLSHSINNKETKRIVVSLILAAITIYNSMFCWYYFHNYNNDIKDSFNPGFDIALTDARSSAHANEPIYISHRVSGSYWYVLHFVKVDPVDFQKHSRILISNGEYQVVSYRNYYFDPDAPELRSAPSFVALLKDDEEVSCGNRVILYSEGIWTIERCFY